MQSSTRLVRMIENNADELTKKWLTIVRRHPGTPTYHKYDETALYNRAYRVYSQLGNWLSQETDKDFIARHYNALGARRRREEFALSEVVQALILTRRVLWFKIMSDGLLDSALELHLALELNNQVAYFFDRAIYFTVVGYEQGKLDQPEKLSLPPEFSL